MSQVLANPTTGLAATKPDRNPAQSSGVPERKRIPMSIPQTRLSVPEIPGFVLYWHLGKNVQRAIKAGYEFVQDDELELSESGVSSTRESADLGTRVSSAAGAEMLDAQGQPERLYLMKLRKEWWDDDQKAKEKGSEELLQSLRIGSPNGAGDTTNRYVGEQNKNIFKPPKRSA